MNNEGKEKELDSDQNIKRAVTGASELPKSSGQTNNVNKMNSERNRNLDHEISGPDIVEYELSSFDNNEMNHN